MRPSATPEPTLVEMKVRGLILDPVSKMPVVILQQPGHDGYLPIWIGVWEANSIALQLEGVSSPRPMTHDLIASLVRTIGFKITKVTIHTLADNVFIASICLTNDNGVQHEVDARPSDALAIALRAGATILVNTDVLAHAQVGETSEEEALRLILERLRPEDLGEYEM